MIGLVRVRLRLCPRGVIKIRVRETVMVNTTQKPNRNPYPNQQLGGS